MFLKIFKHAFMRPLKTVLPLMAVGLAVGLIAGFSRRFYSDVSSRYWQLAMQDGADLTKLRSDRYLMSILSTLNGLATFGVIILAVAEIWMVYFCFQKAVATDEAYLTYTLPATKGQQTGARYLSLVVWNALILVGTALALIIKRAIIGNLSSLGQAGEMNANDLIFGLEVILLLVVVFLSAVAHGQFGIVFSNALSLKLKRRISSFLVGLIFFIEITFLVITTVILLFATANYNDAPHFAIWALIILTGGLGSLAYYFTYKFMGRWLNVA